MLDLRHIGLYTRDEDQDYRLEPMRKLFRRAGIEMFVDVPEGIELDLVIAMGGDGTVLRALAAHPGVPVVAVNFGNVGFLTQCDREGLDNVLVRLLADDYQIEERLTLEVRCGERRWRCINEVVIKGAAHMIEVGMRVNGRLIHTPRGDGVIIGTPTGSTAYLLSTGAPIVTPDVDCIIMQPLNEYSFASRSVIVPGSASVSLEVQAGRDGDIGLAIDGCDRVPLAVGDVVEMQRSPKPARLVYFEADYFFRNLRERLRW
ncbi:MAG: NAD+ kinase [Bradymonadia bacterium]|jgi:NAD+ kinase